MTSHTPPGRSLLTLAAAFCLCALPPRDCGAQWGAVKGRFVLEGEIPDLPKLVEKGDETVKDAVCRVHDVPDESLVVDRETRGVANVFVFLPRPPTEIHPDLQKSAEPEVVFDQKQCRFIPHALFVRTDQRVLVKSDDPTNHNTHTLPLLNTPENQMIAPGDRDGVPMRFRIREPVPVKVTCDLHPWMVAYWLVLDHPYAAVTGAKGAFEITNLPAGTHTLQVWHERVGWIDRDLTVTVEDGGTTDLETISLAAERFLTGSRGK